jgi:PA14 domain.
MKQTIGVILFVGTLVAAFQNCSNVNFSKDAATATESGLEPSIPVICDPLSTGSQAATCHEGSDDGLLGNVYYLPNEKGSVQRYIDYGTRLNIYVQMSNLDIPTRDWTSGFPAPQGVLQDQNGDALIEYFGMDLRGYIKLKDNYNEDDYDFAIASDDGAILDIDGREIVNNDGQHDRQWKCSSESVHLKVGEAKAMRLRYYQGPRVQIALQVYMRPASQRSQGCGDNKGWTIIPSELLKH